MKKISINEERHVKIKNLYEIQKNPEKIGALLKIRAIQAKPKNAMEGIYG